MKMPTLPKMKMPKLPKLPKPQPKRLQATARRAAQPAIDDYDEEPTTRLSSAFVVVLILHVVAVGGIYAFNSIKAHRRGNEVAAVPAAPAPANASTPSQSNAVAAVAPVEQAAPPTTVPETQVAAAAAAAPVEQQPPAAPVSPISGNRIHRVRQGDNLTKVANLYDVSINDLEAANGLKPGAILRPAQVLNIPASKPAAAKTAAVEARNTEPASVRKSESAAKASTPAKTTASPGSSPKTYTVKKGENPVAIARQLGVSYSELMKLNKISDPRKIQIGQVLKVPAKKRD